MKLTKKLQAEILKAYNIIWDAYLKGDMKTFASMLDEDCYIIGSAAGEVFSNKKSAVKYYKSTAEQITGKAEFRNRKIKVMPVEKGFMVNEEADFYLLIDDQWTYYGPCRVSSLFHKKNNKWKVIHQHGSFPDSKTEEGEQVNTDKIKAENIQLRDAVKRRTEELENKNRELEIEAALEKVRAQALGMKKPEDLMDICQVIYAELQLLGFGELRNTMINIYNDEKSSFLDYDYSANSGKTVTVINYNFHPLIEKQVRITKKAKDAFFEFFFTGEELKNFRALRKNNGEQDDPKLDKTNSLHYYFYSIGNGSIGISTYSAITKEKLELLKRFRNVFDFAYRRYMDVAQAEAQAKEARIELALERVRARAMAMHNSDELAELVATVFNELTHLDFKLTSCIIWIHDHEKAMDTLWIASAEMNKPAKPFQVTPFHKGFFGSIIHAWKAKDPKWVYAFTGAEKKKFEKAFFKELPTLPDALKKALNVPKQVVFSASFNNFGGLEIVETEALTDEKFEILHRFGKVFDLSYTRFNDLKKAEAQAREAEIELSLERVRAKTMAMQKPSEFVDVITVIGNQFVNLGFDIEWANFGANGLEISKGFDIWNFAVIPGIYQAAERLFIPYIKHPVFAIAAAGLERYRLTGEDFFVIDLDKKDKDRWMDHMYTRSEFKEMPDELKAIQYNKPGYSSSVIVLKDTWLSIGKFDPKPFTEEQNAILRRFANAFGQSYTRFLDLQKAEAQAREAQIETALERVRSRSMAMHKSDDLHEVIKVVTEQLSVLDLRFNVSNFAKINPDGSWDLWLSTPEQSYPALIHVPYLDHPIFNRITEEQGKGNDFYTDVYTWEETNIFFHHFFENTIAKNSPEERKQFVYSSKGLARSVFQTKNIWLSVARYDSSSFSDEENAIFKRFANVFEQAYTRFLDLQKAEAQARETEIELSLERVRAKTMAMQKPSEFVDVINIIGEQFVHLGFDIDWANFGANGFAISEGIDIWNFAVIPGGSPIAARVFIPYFDHPVFTTSAENIDEFLNGGRDLITVTFDKQIKDTWLDQLFTKTIFKDVPEEYRAIQYAKPGYTTSNISIKDTWLSIGKFDSRPFTEEQHSILRRFAKAFGQANTRFLDLQKAEAQAREAQVEASLERVRSRAMAMQNSDELKELIGTVFTELTKLDIVLTRCLIMIYDPRSNDSVWWMANSEAPTEPIGLRIQNHEHPPYTAYLKAWQEKKLNWVYVLEGAVKKDWDNFLFVETELSHLPDFVIAGMKAPDRVYLNASFNTFGNLTLATLEPLSNEHFDIMLRFAKVFDLTYTRFNDLKQAEAQAKEARIEAALERVRARTMAMQKPDELADAAQILYREFATLNIKTFSCGYMFIDEEKHTQTAWVVLPDGTLLPNFIIFPLTGDHVLDNRYKDWKEKKPLHLYEIEGEVNKEHHKFLSNHVPPFVVKDIFSKVPDRIVFHCANFSNGYLLILATDYFSQEEQQTVIRFAKVFEMTYTRFLDLKQAEAQTREAQIELALERVRARTMAMHKSEELAETSQVLFHQLSELGGIPDRIAIGIADETKSVVNFWTTDQQGSHLDHSFSARLNERTTIAKTYQAWKEQKKSLVIDLHGEELTEWIKFAREEMGITVKDDQIKDRRVHSLAFFSHGWILATSHEPQYSETIQILERFASVFNLTYRRFLDLQKAEAQANEARIEIALERIRARALAMHKSDELMEVANVLREQMALLGQPELESSVVHLYEEDPDHILSWRSYRAKDPQSKIGYGHMAIPKNCCEVVREWLTKFHSELKEYTIEISGAKQEEWYEILFKLAPDVVNSMRQENSIHEKRYYRFSKFSGGALLMVSKQEPSEEVTYLQRRAAVVFDLAYRRFSDLQKAEAQAREAQIETALEKVRSRSLAMHKSDELQEVVDTVFERLQDLNIEMASANIAIFKEGTRNYDYWIASPAQKRSASFHMPYKDISLTRDLIAARESGKEFSTTAYSFEEKNEWFGYAFKDTDFKFLSEERKQFILNAPGITVAIAFSKNTGVQVNRYTSKLYTEGEGEILKRFSKVFEQAYIRFLDLEKAEAQAREAQIETVLERVRSRTMAMQKSDELTDVAGLLFEQVSALGIKTWTAGFNVWSEDNNSYVDYITSPQGGFIEPYTVYTDTAEALTDISNARKSGVEFDVQYVEGEKIKQLYLALTKLDEKQYEIMLQDGVRFPSHQYEHFVFGSKVSLMFITYEPVPEAHDIFKRLGKVFEQTYTRFLDLQKAEAQAREAQIEASLERVRSKTMAMHNSQDVGETVAVMFDELRKLDIETLRCGVGIMLENYQMELWTARPGATGKVEFIVGNIDMKLHPLLTGGYEAWKNRAEGFFYQLKDEDLKTYFDAINSHQAYPAKYDISSLPSLMFHYEFNFNEGCLFAFSVKQFSDESSQIFKRFTGVFGQTYRRFLDLQKAEANAREAQIEAGLERVRAKAMAMHSSKDLAETLSVFYRELKSLSVVPIRCGVALMDKESRMAELTTMNTTGEGDSIEIIGKIKMAGHPVLDGVFESWLVQKEYHAVLRGNQIKEYYQVLKPQIDYLDYSHDEAQFGYYFMFNEGDVYAWTEKELTEDELTIYRRFTTVISLTYKRYKDLQQAEAQAKEAKIEAGLERVRARTMAMHSSEDVGAATATMFTELEKLGIQNLRGGITIIKAGDKQEVWGVTNLPDGRTIRSIGEFDMHLHALWRELLKAKVNNGDYNYYRLAGKDKEDYINILNTTPSYLSQPIKDFPDVHVQSYFFGEGAIWTNSLEPHSEEDKLVMKRFASVFSLTFRRYQDLKKAEAQTREATIETALEKVRGKAMAMHNSNDLTATASLVFTELRKLGISPMRCGVGMLNKEDRKGLLYTAIASEEGDSLSQIGWVLLDVHPVLRSVYDHWIRGEDYFPVLKEEVLRSFYEQLKSGFVVPEEQTKYEHHGYFLPFSEGVFYGWSEKPFTELEIKVLKRFASVIDLTFRRYIELQKSETNAREAVKQAALDRVRAEIASMRTINDLDRITPLIWNELTILGIPFIRCGVFIMDDEQELIHTFLSTPDGKAIAAFHLPYDTPGNLAHVVANWKKNKKYIDHWDETEFIQFADILVKEGALVSSEQYLKTIPKGGFYLHFLPFLQGMLYVGNTDQLKEEEIELIQHVADAFSTAYARYEDFNKLESAKQQVEKTLTDLKQAQTQLVQSEKMASLGEMTAGIAHEIQNPLNFVNNFSEVSKELLDEMKTELETGNTEDAKDIADDVIQNLEKINHHGKRADAIVKSMLQHSRSSSGKKEPADINGLADEYLRLAYHGLRAKDKSFNAKFETEFDSSIGKINIISQDIGRVLVNLINNAFYAVSERKKQESNGYEPTVTVHTKKTDDKIEIMVKDNGNGIPQKVLDKIFQPFFTTKPTGQGTGLGLSLAYDIVTKGHGGELKVETKEGEGSEFIIQLPVN